MFVGMYEYLVFGYERNRVLQTYPMSLPPLLKHNAESVLFHPVDL